jgi:TIR domain
LKLKKQHPLKERKQPKKQSPPDRDHLFINYATEDLPFVEWLTLRLTAEGYKVWCDRIKLLGGESYPKDIDVAIKWRTFRFLAVLSHNSVSKRNPLKERTMALNLARERNENFVVPLNLDGISPSDLDWMVSDLTFISFHLGWADGLKQLLKLLEASNTPREFHDGEFVASRWFDAKHFVTNKHERLWTNLAEVKELPRDIYRYETSIFIPADDQLQLLRQWPHVREGETLWAFEPPPSEFAKKYNFVGRRRWKNWNLARASDARIRFLAVRLLNESLKSVALSRGLKLTPDGSGCYFPDELLPNNRLSFDGYDGKRTWITPVGVRNFRTPTGRESCRYHLVPHTRVWLDHEFGCVVLVRIHFFLTTLDGTVIEGKAALRRRKRICRSWWNHHWLMRSLAMLQFLAGNTSSIRIGEDIPNRLVISKHPLTADIRSGLDESQIGLEKPDSEDSEAVVLELEADEPGNGEADIQKGEARE